MRLAAVATSVAMVWAILLLALGRGAFVIPKAEAGTLARRAARWTVLAGLPCFFLLSMVAGELTGLIPLPARAQSALATSFLALPVYSMLVAVAVVEHNAQYRRAPGLVRFLGRFVVVVISLVAALITLSAILSSAGPYFAS